MKNLEVKTAFRSRFRGNIEEYLKLYCFSVDNPQHQQRVKEIMIYQYLNKKRLKLLMT
jgi:hypothetical protein